MSTSSAGATREGQALAEIGLTKVAAAGAAALVGLFLLLLVAGIGTESVAAASGRSNLLHGESRLTGVSAVELIRLARAEGFFAATNRLRRAAADIQDRLDRDSQLATLVRSPLQAALVRYLRFGNSQVLVGEQSWLFYRDDFEYLTGPPFLDPPALARRARGSTRHPAGAPDPLPALLGLAAELRARGIGLIVVPVPTKLGIAWERFLGRRDRGGPAIENPSRESLLSTLRQAGVSVFDPAPLLRDMELRDERPYMQFDSHWSPAGLDRVAAGLAVVLDRDFELGPQQRFHRQKRTFDRRADLADLLGLVPEQNPYLIEPLQILTVDGPGDRPFNSRRGESRVLLVGDSFSRLLIRNKRKGGDANFAAQLAFHLRRPVDMLAENDGGAEFARRSRWLRQPQELDGRAVVVFEVAERAFALGDWSYEQVPSPPAAP